MLSYVLLKLFCFSGEIYVTSKRYVAVEDDELSFEIGVNLQILEKNFDGWWKASWVTAIIVYLESDPESILSQ